jgi:hypothetical protein
MSKTPTSKPIEEKPAPAVNPESEEVIDGSRS